MRLQAREQLRGQVVRPGQLGGRFKPLTDRDVERIHDTALSLLDEIGMANPIPALLERAMHNGCRVSDQGRLCFPRALVEDTIATLPRDLVFYGRDPRHDIEHQGARVHFGGCGNAVRLLDPATGQYRPSTLRDVYDCGRLVDSLEHIHEYSRWMIATDLSHNIREADINTAYASLAATEKNVSLGFESAENVDAVLEMARLIAGGDKKFRERPFCCGGGCCVVSPLSYSEENSQVCIASTAFGAPVWIVVAPQAGTTAPAALAGTLALSVAEALAGVLLVSLVVPGHPVDFGPWPFVSDLRTGAFSGGGGEVGILNAAAAQIANYYNLPCSVSGGMTDAKLPDNQAGYEKGVNVTLAALAGANSVGEAAGMMGSLMGCSYESAVIDNDMIGCVQRALRGIEVTDETLSFEVIRDVVLNGPGHFLTNDQTLNLMDTEYLHPEIADRSSIEDWEMAGSPDIRQRATARVREILSSHYPKYIDGDVDQQIRGLYPIRLPESAMRPDSGRWPPPT